MDRPHPDAWPPGVGLRDSRARGFEITHLGTPTLVLASRSPQRRTILEQLGVRFEVRWAQIEELEEGDPADVAIENARRKAIAAADRGDVPREAAVLGVDTLVALGESIYGKPGDATAAARTLRALSGARHTVFGGVAVLRAGELSSALARTAVTFDELNETTIEWYLASGEWRDRAGGYAIQGRGAALVRAIEGDYTNVVGLPVALLAQRWPELLTPRQ